jgi:hypothetical protein
MEAQGHNNNNLERLDSMERKLSSLLDKGEETADYGAIFQIYSHILNNAEIASNQIKASDPLKKQWYKKVLDYQIKQKQYKKKHDE